MDERQVETFNPGSRSTLEAFVNDYRDEKARDFVSRLIDYHDYWQPTLPMAVGWCRDIVSVVTCASVEKGDMILQITPPAAATAAVQRQESGPPLPTFGSVMG